MNKQNATKLEIGKDSLTLNGEAFYLASGDIQYFRIHSDEWKDRLTKMKAFGLTAVQIYCPWNLHEPKEGVFDFEGILDLGAFLRICDELGLKVLLRPGPYICAEFDFGGLPWWLLKDRHMRLRCADSKYLAKVDAYFERISKEFLPYLSTNGGPVIAVCVENEYGTFGADLDYLEHLKNKLTACGVDVPLYQTDNSAHGTAFTAPLGIWQGINYRLDSKGVIGVLRAYQADKPAFVGEYWSGRAVFCGENGDSRDIAPIVKSYKDALDLNAYLSFYMFAGGTNFGFMNGALVSKPFDGNGEMIFRPYVTSYNCDALLSESGRATEKYYACKNVLSEHLCKTADASRLPEPSFQTAKCDLDKTAPLFENLDKLGSAVKAPEPLTFEELDCPYGYVLYSVTLPHGIDIELPITVDKVRDHAIVFIDGERKGEIYRDRPAPEIKCNAKKPHRLDILTENMGRNNSRPQFAEEKGILGEVKFGSSRVYGFTCTPLSLLSPINGSPFHIDLSILDFTNESSDMPRFMRGIFEAKAGIPTNLSIEGLGKGFAVINGFHIGRYWNIGPQNSLYIPGGLLRDGENELILFEETDKEIKSVSFVDTPAF